MLICTYGVFLTKIGNLQYESYYTSYFLTVTIVAVVVYPDISIK